MIAPSLTIAFLSFATLPWEPGLGHPSAPLEVRPSARIGFTLLAPSETGIAWTNVISEENVARSYNLVSGGGVAAGDFDRDGHCDLFFCNRGGENALFRNLGNGRFQNATHLLPTASKDDSSTGAVFADIDGNGHLDLLVHTFRGPNRVFLNSGAGTFTDFTKESGLSARGGATSLALGDLDGDGDLDLYAAYFGIESILREGGRISYKMVNGQPVVTGRHARRLKVVDGQLTELGEQDALYLNDGRGIFSTANWADSFADESGQPILSSPLDFGLSVQIRDVNEDGFPDIYVCNDFQTPDRLWMNNGRAHFRALPRLALRNMSYASMGVDFADIDRDGRLDFLTVEMLARQHARRQRQLSSMPPVMRQPGAFDEPEPIARNALYWNRGDGTYAEIACLSGLAATDWSWTPIFLDVDLDGFEDLLVSAGSLYDVMDADAATEASRARKAIGTRELLALYPPLRTRNAAFRNRGNLTFEDATDHWGFRTAQISFGMCAADLDNDGDLDLAVNCANTAPLVYRNDSAAPRVAVRLKGQPPNTQGIGAKVYFHGGAVPVQFQEIICGGRYLSGGQAQLVFAPGTNRTGMRIEVIWRSGKRSVVTAIQANRVFEIDEPKAIP